MNQPDKFISLEDVMRITTLSRSGIYAAASNGTFPPSIKIGRHKVAWRESEVNSWVYGVFAPPINTPKKGFQKNYSKQFEVALISALNGLLASGKAASPESVLETATKYAEDVVEILKARKEA